MSKYQTKWHLFKVRVKSILRIVCKHIINVRNALLKHVTKTVNYVVLNCGVRPLNSFTIFVIRIFLGGAKSGLDDAIEPPSTAPFPTL